MADDGFSDETLRRLEQRLDRASETAERLIAEAAREAAHQAPQGAAQQAAPKPPPAGWQQAEPQPAESDSPLSGEVDLLVGILGSLLHRIPPELQQRLADAVREVLLALRALIDWYLERSDRRRAQPPEVQDIPIL